MKTSISRRVTIALRSFFRRRTVERELDDELQFHFEQMAAQETARNGDAANGYAAARRTFGGMNQVKEACRDARTLRPLEHLLQDVRFGARLLARGPVFTTVAVLSLALGIGANTAIFSLLNAIVIRPLPVEAPSELRVLEVAYRDEVGRRFSYPLVTAARAQLQGRAEICGQSSIQPMLVAGPNAAASQSARESVQVQLFTGDCFRMLRETAQVGRLLGPQDDEVRGKHPVAVISDSYWSRRFGHGTSAVGSDIVVNDTPLSIVGVTQPEFFGSTVAGRTPDIWAPAMMQAELRYSGNMSNIDGDTRKPWVSQREISWLNVMLRVPPGTDPAVAQTLQAVNLQQTMEISAVANDADLRERTQASRVQLADGARGFSDVRSRMTTPLYLMLAMVGLVLIVASANLASLLLARASHRQREMAVRLSMGAGRGRLIRQLLTESLLLALLGGAVGLLVASWCSQLLLQAGNREPVTGIDVGLDWRVLAFTFAVSVLTGLLFGLLPAIRSTRVSLSEVLKAQSRTTAGVGRAGSLVSKTLISGQIAFSLLLLIVAALFARSLRETMKIDVGFDRQHLVVARLDPQTSGYQPADLPSLHRRLVERVAALPGVQSVSLSGDGPLSGSRTVSSFEVQGYTRARDERLRAQEESVTPGYFETVGLRIVRGRGFTDADVLAGRKVSVINETMARRYFSGRDPIGGRWSYDSDFGPDSFEVVGVVADARYNELRAEVSNMAYRPAAQSEWYMGSLEARTTGDPRQIVSTLQSALREVEPRLSVRGVDTIEERVSRATGTERMLSWLTAVFGGVALCLACLGLYGTVSYAVTRRTTELGVRMALGADRGAVQRLILRESSRLVAAGLGAGLVMALAASQLLKGLLYGVNPIDGQAYAAAALALIGIAAVAAYLPARRASRLDPVNALRAD